MCRKTFKMRGLARARQQRYGQAHGGTQKLEHLEYPDRISAALDAEEQSLRLLFSHVKTFAVGHGCAAGWNDPAGDATTGIRTESLPSYEIKPIVPRQVENLDLAMEELAAESDKPATLWTAPQN